VRKERVINAIQHKATDLIPYNIELTKEELIKVSESLRIKPDYFPEYVGNHIEKITYNDDGVYIKPGVFRDEFGVIWNKSGLHRDIGTIETNLLKEPNLKVYHFPEPNIDRVRKLPTEAINNGRDTFKFSKLFFAYFERAWSLRGMENLLMDFLLNPSFVEKLLEHILHYNLRIIEVVVQESEIDGFYFGDDYGQQNGLIMSPDTWRKFIKPGLSKMFRKVKECGKVVALHSCGNITEILCDLIEIGLDIYQTVQPEVYNLKWLKKEYGKDLTFWGGISTQQLLPFASPNELKADVRKTLHIMSNHGGYIASPTHKITQDIPVENVLALIEVLKFQQ
jgi:uroporphyrinogen decarboxylase